MENSKSGQRQVENRPFLAPASGRWCNLFCHVSLALRWQQMLHPVLGEKTVLGLNQASRVAALHEAIYFDTFLTGKFVLIGKLRSVLCRRTKEEARRKRWFYIKWNKKLAFLWHRETLWSNHTRIVGNITRTQPRQSIATTTTRGNILRVYYVFYAKRFEISLAQRSDTTNKIWKRSENLYAYKLRDVYGELVVGEKLVYAMNNSLKHVISVDDGLAKFYGLSMWRVVDCSTTCYDVCRVYFGKY